MWNCRSNETVMAAGGGGAPNARSQMQRTCSKRRGHELGAVVGGQRTLRRCAGQRGADERDRRWLDGGGAGRVEPELAKLRTAGHADHGQRRQHEARRRQGWVHGDHGLSRFHVHTRIKLRRNRRVMLGAHRPPAPRLETRSHCCHLQVGGVFDPFFIVQVQVDVQVGAGAAQATEKLLSTSVTVIVNAFVAVSVTCAVSV